MYFCKHYQKIAIIIREPIFLFSWALIHVFLCNMAHYNPTSLQLFCCLSFCITDIYQKKLKKSLFFELLMMINLPFLATIWILEISLCITLNFFFWIFWYGLVRVVLLIFRLLYNQLFFIFKILEFFWTSFLGKYRLFLENVIR